MFLFDEVQGMKPLTTKHVNAMTKAELEAREVAAVLADAVCAFCIESRDAPVLTHIGIFRPYNSLNNMQACGECDMYASNAAALAAFQILEPTITRRSPHGRHH